LFITKLQQKIGETKAVKGHIYLCHKIVFTSLTNGFFILFFRGEQDERRPVVSDFVILQQDL
jgi:hypothetical protein